MKKWFLMMLLASAGVASADSLEEARQLVTEGDYPAAAAMISRLKAANPKLTANAQFLYLEGVCDFEEGNYQQALKNLTAAKSKGNGAANLYLGRLAFLDYDFEKATDLYDAFRSYREKLRQVAGEPVEKAERQLAAAENALGRVEKITVLDSIAVPLDGFFSHYSLPPSAGKLIGRDGIAVKNHGKEAEMAFVSENGDFMIWGEPDSVGNVCLMQSERLGDGIWQDPEYLPAHLNKGGYADFPFMMSDGTTLYYASNGNESMGGYDIFVVSRDPQTGEYLQPSNVGMPFNSPYDDFMMAIDEENGIGWWATDRNLLGDKITIYVYKTNDLRTNYPSDTEDLIEKAKLTDYRSTWNPDEEAQIEDWRQTALNAGKGTSARKIDFVLPMDGGRNYTVWSDFRSSEARQAMKIYLEALKGIAQEETRLQDLQRRYAARRADNVRSQIEAFEKDLDRQRREVDHLRSEVYRLEKQSR